MATSNVFCNICFERCKSTDEIVSSNCGHMFHHVCLKNWLTHDLSCPDCRSPNPTVQRLFLNIEEPSLAKKKLIQKLEESEQDFFSVQKALSLKEDQYNEINNEFELQKAQIASYEQELFEVKNALKEGEKTFMAAIQKKENEIDQLSSDFTNHKKEVTDLINQLKLELDEEDKNDSQIKTRSCNICHDKIGKFKEILTGFKIEIINEELKNMNINAL